MLRRLGARPGDRALDVGAGSGWTPALLAHLVGPDGEVRGVDLEPPLAGGTHAAVSTTGRTWAAGVSRTSAAPASASPRS